MTPPDTSHKLPDTSHKLPRDWYKNYWHKFVSGHKSQILPFLPVLSFCLKKGNVWAGGIWIVYRGVWMMPGGSWMVSWWCVRVSGDLPIPNPFAKNYKGSDIAFSSNALWCITNSYVWECLDDVYGRLEGVWMVSGWCLRVSGRCVGGKDVI